jgi:hypothetical protein
MELDRPQASGRGKLPGAGRAPGVSFPLDRGVIRA